MLRSPGLSFSLAKDSYHQHDHVQRAVEKKLKLMAFQEVKSASDVLELGCGDGVASLEMARELQVKRYDAVDIADVLIDKARKLSTKHTQKEYAQALNFFSANFDEVEFWQVLQPKKYDLIYSNMALQWSVRLDLLLQYVDTVLADGGLFAFSIPMYGTFDELAAVARINEFTTHDLLLAYMRDLDWELISIEHQKFELIFPEKLAQLKHLKSTGVNSYLGNETPKVKSLRHYLTSENNNGELPGLSYQVGFYVIRNNNEP